MERVVIFIKSSYCMSYNIKTLIRNFGANPTVYELEEFPNGMETEKALVELGCKPSVPPLFIGKELVNFFSNYININLYVIHILCFVSSCVL
ncbi:hypothetical protein MTR67_019673 [Solanum verrucosum]|uniref:Glutaredoxin domain-containing protein n=1 Tax=Solanum verrucosum TaxID=315347 RepID=A0AAF0TV13_SOLVR|nr:hypothetical protein MTR67_019673 [Solanum verrucosum]